MMVLFLRHTDIHQVFAILSFKDLQDASTKSKLLYHDPVSFPVLKSIDTAAGVISSQHSVPSSPLP